MKRSPYCETLVNVQLPVVDIVVQFIKVHDRKRKETNEMEDPLSGSLLLVFSLITDVKHVWSG